MNTKRQWIWDYVACELRDSEGALLLRSTHTHEPSKATGSLIAAAPDMLEALKTISKRLHNEPHYVQKGIVKLADEAIRKAKAE